MWRSGPKVYIQLIIPKLSIITGSIARSASRRYLIYSDADVEVIRPAGATRCIHGMKFGVDEGTEGPLFHAKFHPICA